MEKEESGSSSNLVLGCQMISWRSDSQAKYPWNSEESCEIGST